MNSIPNWFRALRPHRWLAAWLLLLLVAAQPGCNAGKFFSPGSGRIEVQGRWPDQRPPLATKLIPDLTAAIEVTLSGAGMATPRVQRVSRADAGPDRTFTIFFENVPLGTKTMDVRLRDAAGAQFYATQVVVSVEGGKTVEATLDLNVPQPQVSVAPSASPSASASPSPSPSLSASPTATAPPATPTPPTPTPGPTVYVATTIAGSTQGFADGSGTNAQFQNPDGIALARDGSGNIYVADSSNHRIRMVTPAGVVTTLAGSGAQGAADGTGLGAQFFVPRGMAVDSGGNIYVTDANFRLRKVTPAGVVTTIAGSSQGFADGTGANAQFSNPQGVAVDAQGDIYVVDQGANRIRKVTPAGVVTTFAGSGAGGFADGTGNAAQFSNPTSLTIDAAGNFYVADSSNGSVRKMTATAVVTTLAGNGTPGSADGTGTGAQFSNNLRVGADAGGNVYVGDGGNNRVRKITLAGVVITIAGSASAGTSDGAGAAAQFNTPTDLVVDGAGVIYLTDKGNHRIRKLQPFPANQLPSGTLLGTFSTGSGSGDIAFDAAGNAWVTNYNTGTVTKLSSTGAALGSFNIGQAVRGIEVDANGIVWVSRAQFSNTVTKLDLNGNVVGTCDAGNPSNDLKIDSGNNIWVAHNTGNTVTRLSNDCSSIQSFTVGTGPNGLAIDGAGNVYTANGSGSVSKLSPAGVLQGTFPTTFGSNSDVAIDSQGNIWVAHQDANPGHVSKLSSTGTPLDSFTVSGIPAGIAIGPGDFPWVSTQGVQTLVKLSQAGQVLVSVNIGVAANDVAVDSQGNIWVANQDSSNVMKFAP